MTENQDEFQAETGIETTTAPERIMAISRDIFKRVIEPFHGFRSFALEPALADKMRTLLLQAEFHHRGSLEADPSWKQIIPYVVVRCLKPKISDAPYILRYYRTKQAGEERLHGKASIGIGGHVDDTVLQRDLYGYLAYLSGMWREINEEINIQAQPLECPMVGLLNDDTTDVGKVHLGLVHMLTLDGDEVTAEDPELTDLEFVRQSELKKERDKMETWSRLLLDSMLL